MPIGAGETFERYAIEALIGRGGMGEVYRAVDTRLRRKVALKVLRPDKDRPDAVARLYREARAAAALTHPNTVAVHDAGEAEGVFYLVMELVRGEPLLAFIGDARVPLERKIGWLVDVARALAAAHRAGIVHRDVKPSNVMVSEDGPAKVLDFGLARPIDGPVDPVSFRTQDGHVLGTLRYMAPEQLVGALADERSDQYAFGLTAYELLAGTHPGGALVEAPPRALAEAAPAVPLEVASIVMRALSARPSERYPSMDDVVDALEKARHAPARVPPSPGPIRIGSSDPPAASAATIAAGSVLGKLANAAKPEPAATTLVSKEAPSALVRARDLAAAAAAAKDANDAKAKRKELADTAKRPRAGSASAPKQEPAPAKPRRWSPTVVAVTVAVLAVAALAGTYLETLTR